MIARRNLLAVAAVVDVALHARGQPVAAKALAARNGLAPRHLEPLLQELVRTNILKGTRGPRGGYELARERRRITAGDIVRALDMLGSESEDRTSEAERTSLFDDVIAPMVADAAERFLATLDAITVDDLCRRAEDKHSPETGVQTGDFHI